MKRFLAIAAMTILAACCTQSKAPKALVLYYSQTGNTEVVAKALQASLGADIEAILPVVPYDGDFQATIERSRKEMDEGAFPEIQPVSKDIKSYDIIFLGFPVWFGTYAPPIETLLKSADFSGKKIVPFCTFGSGGLETSVAALKAKLPDSEILPGYGVRAARLDAVPKEIDRFLKEGKFIEGEVEPLEAFSAPSPATEEEAAIFDAAVGDYPMIKAKADEVRLRDIPGGKEYIFTAKDTSRFGNEEPVEKTITVYVLAEDGKAPVFTKVAR